MVNTLNNLVKNLYDMFSENKIDNALCEANFIIEDVLNIKKYQFSEITLDKVQKEKLNIIYEFAKRRISGEPLQYILGKWEFYGLPFYVGKGVLIPRQDTETLVDAVIQKSKNRNFDVIYDLCSGSGCIAVTLKKYIDESDVYAVELSDKAFSYLTKNITLNNVKVNAVNKNIFDSYFDDVTDIDCLVSNPPYLTKNDMNNLQKEVTFEPALALAGGDDGLLFYRNIISHWKQRIKTGGIIAFEIGIGQHNDVNNILEENGFNNIEFIKDLCGVIRVVIAEKY